jgi:NAD(P)-dependent dehydrogenase (short-subunit alcohol dehydrogenase family)
VARVEEAQRHGVIAFVRLVQTLDSLGWLNESLAIRVVTEGVHPQLDDSVLPYAGGLSGLSGSLAKEYPRLDVACLDIDPAEYQDDSTARHIMRSIVNEPAQRAGEKIALRKGRRFCLRLRLAEMPPAEASSFRQGGIYLIVGGAGRVGFELSLYLAEKFKAKLLWIGRRPCDARIDELLKRIHDAGGEALYYQGRGDDLLEMREAFRLIERQFGRPNGVVHSSLVFQDVLLRNLDEAVCREILDSKTRSAAVLAELTSDLSLDFLLFLGSAQSFFNEARRGAYAAGSCFVDAYARYLQQRSLFPVHVINWGFWNHSFDSHMQETIRVAGLDVIHPAEGVHVIETILANGTVQAAYLKANLEALHRMGIDPSNRCVYLPKIERGMENLETLLTASLFN